MPNDKPFTWSMGADVAAEQVSFAFDFVLGRGPADDADRNRARHIANRYPKPRLELLRYLTSQPDFLVRNRDVFALFVDQAMRRAIFAQKRPPKVNLFCVGAARAGTTWLSGLLAKSPHVYSPSIKETNFFSHFSSSATPKGFGHETYEMYYFGWTNQPILTDFSPTYLRYRHALDGVLDYNPDAKIIICLRDPVERALSAYFYTMPQRGRGELCLSSNKAFENSNSISIHRSRGTP